MSGLSVGPLALILAAAIYVLKRWWDGADQIMVVRQEVYDEYYRAVYDLTYACASCSKMDELGAVEIKHEELQLKSPRFYLYGSPLAISISDVFYNRYWTWRTKVESKEASKDEFKLVHEASGVLREVMKSEMFLLSPRFQLERYRHKARWKEMAHEAGENSQLR